MKTVVKLTALAANHVRFLIRFFYWNYLLIH